MLRQTSGTGSIAYFARIRATGTSIQELPGEELAAAWVFRTEMARVFLQGFTIPWSPGQRMIQRTLEFPVQGKFRPRGARLLMAAKGRRRASA